VTAGAHAADPHAGHHGPPIANQSSRVSAPVLGMFLFIGSEVMLFGAFLNTAILVTSSATIHLALQSIKRGNHAGLQAGLVLTVALGLTFLLTQVIEYARIGFAFHEGAFAAVFFGLTGLHGGHVFVGLTLLTFATIRAFRGHYTPEHHHGVELPGIYWHFVDVMWIVVYFTVYIL
jgi:cytochrome c oxidase subunit 3